MNLRWFPTRLTLALAVMVLILLIHAHLHMQALLTLAGVGLVAWSAIEIRQLIRHRNDGMTPRGR